MTAKRKMHFLSRFYMAGFTASGGRRDILFVTSKIQDRQWREHAEDVAHKRDLFRPDGAEFDPDVLEDGFAAIERQIAPVLAEVIKTQALPEDEERLALLLYLPAMNAARPPAEIEALEDHVDRTMRDKLLEGLTADRRARMLQKWEADGRDPRHVQDLESLKEWVRAGGIRIKVGRNHVLAGLWFRMTLLVGICLTRTWVLLVANEPGVEFVTSDRPVPLLNNQNVPAGTQPRFDDPRYDVLLPLSRHLCLVGRPGGKRGVTVASRVTVRFINTIIATGAADYIYSSGSDFVTLAGDCPGPDVTDAYLGDIERAAVDAA